MRASEALYGEMRRTSLINSSMRYAHDGKVQKTRLHVIVSIGMDLFAHCEPCEVGEHQVFIFGGDFVKLGRPPISGMRPETNR